MKKILFALTLGAALNAAQATIFFNDTFTYADGALTNVSDNAWVAHSGYNVGPVQVSSGKATIYQNSSAKEDVSRATGHTMGAGDTWYAGFDVDVTGGTISGGEVSSYFASFITGSYFASKPFVVAPTSGGDFKFGFSASANSAAKTWATDGTFGTTYRLVLSYDYDSKECRLWVNPTAESSIYLSDTATYQNAYTGFALREGSPSTGSSTEVLDNLVVANNFTEALTGVAVPEPGSIGLSLLGLALVALRRARA